MLQVIDGQIVKHSLPKTGVLKDGRTVSGYDALPVEILAEEGWHDDPRDSYTYDAATEQLEGPIVEDGKPVYKVVAKPAPEPAPEPVPDRLDILEGLVADLAEEILLGGS